jgi:hypothetical protein
MSLRFVTCRDDLLWRDGLIYLCLFRLKRVFAPNLGLENNGVFNPDDTACTLFNYRNNCYTFSGEDLKMKKVILSLAIFCAAAAVNAQTAAELIGKWKLASWTLKGKQMDIKSTFKTDDVFQIFKEGNEFVSVIGNKTTNGTWALSADNKQLTIKVGGKTIVFTIDSFTSDKRVITADKLGTSLYVKQ